MRDLLRKTFFKLTEKQPAGCLVEINAPGFIGPGKVSGLKELASEPLAKPAPTQLVCSFWEII